MKKQAFEPLSMLAGAATLGAKHHLMDSLGSFLLRRTPLRRWTDPYYASMSRAGMEAGVDSNKNILPLSRKMFGMFMPSTSGLVDYEAGKGLMKNMPSGAQHHLLNNPRATRLISNYMPNRDKSWEAVRGSKFYEKYAPKVNNVDNPLVRNMVNGLTQDKEHWMVKGMRNFSEGKDNNYLQGPLAMGFSGWMGGGHGAEGVLGNMASTAMPVAADAAFRSNRASMLGKSKAKLLASGIEAGSGKSPIWDKVNSVGLSIAEPAMYEMYDATRSATKGMDKLRGAIDGIQPHMPKPLMPVFDKARNFINKPREMIQHHANMPWRDALNHDLGLGDTGSGKSHGPTV